MNTGTTDKIVYESIVAACSQTDVIALPTQVGQSKISLAVHSRRRECTLKKSYEIIKRNSRSGRWSLRLSDLHLQGVTGSTLQILGKVSLHVVILTGTPATHLDFYVVNNFHLSVNGLLGLEALKSNPFTIESGRNYVIYQGKGTKVMPGPKALATLINKSLSREEENNREQCEATTSRAISSVHVTRDNHDSFTNWKIAKFTVVD